MTVPSWYNSSCPSPVTTVTIISTHVYNSAVNTIHLYPRLDTELPASLLLCDGALYSRTEYPELFAAVGTTYGAGDGSTTFAVPSLDPPDEAFVYVIQASSVASVAGEYITAEINVVLAPGGTSGSVVLQVKSSDGSNAAGIASMRLWFIDSLTNTGLVSVVPPATPGVSELEILTNDNGAYVLGLEHTDTERTWYLCVAVGSRVVISEAITLGV